MSPAELGEIAARVPKFLPSVKLEQPPESVRPANRLGDSDPARQAIRSLPP